MYGMCDSVTGLMILGMYMQLKVLRLSTTKLFKQSPRYTSALGDACFPKDNLPKLLDALGLLSREVFQAESSWVRVVEQPQQAQVQLDKPQPAQGFFYQEGFGDSVALFFWKLLSWHSATGSWNGFWHRISSDRFFSLPSVSVPFFSSPFI